MAVTNNVLNAINVFSSTSVFIVINQALGRTTSTSSNKPPQNSQLRVGVSLRNLLALTVM